MSSIRFMWVVAAVAGIAACGSEPTDQVADMMVGQTDFGMADFGTTADLGGSEDSGAPDVSVGTDAGTSMPDQGMSSVPLAGFGEISGDCGVLDDELTSMNTHFLVNALDFGMDPYDDADAALLTDGGREIIADGNAGGNSLLSEIFAYEVLARCEGAVLLKTETEIDYVDDMGKITDLLVEIDGLKIGVSVTRALAFPFEDPYTPMQADGLLADKLGDILLSTANVQAGDAWTKQILHVLAYSPMHADSLRAAYESLDPGLTSDTVVFVTVTNGADEPLY